MKLRGGSRSRAARRAWATCTRRTLWGPGASRWWTRPSRRRAGRSRVRCVGPVFRRTAAVSVTFEDGGSVRMGAPAPSALKLRPPRWRVRAGPAHLDTCEFEVDVAGGRVAFCGYVDRGQRTRAVFAEAHPRVGLRRREGRLAAAAGLDARPSNQFRMSGPARDKEERAALRACRGGVSRARSSPRASRREFSIPVVVGCTPPSTRRAVRSISSSVVSALRRSLIVAPVSL